MDYKLFLEAKRAYQNEQNVMELVKNSHDHPSTSLAIEIAYDLQAGTYIQDYYANQANKRRYTDEGGKLLGQYLTENSVVLNVGAGELWTISLMLDAVKVMPKRVYNLEISWSRIDRGRAFWAELHQDSIDMKPVVADMLEVPLPSNSVDIVTSSHALEPNGTQLECILTELFRVARNKCVLFEPSYEHASPEGKQRMDKLGYIKNVSEIVKKLGGQVDEIIPLANAANELNPTACFVISPPPCGDLPEPQHSFSIPGTDYPLEFKDDCYYSVDTGLAFPLLQGIPIFKSANAILASKFVDA